MIGPAIAGPERRGPAMPHPQHRIRIAALLPT
jgi:hypothetical protein